LSQPLGRSGRRPLLFGGVESRTGIRYSWEQGVSWRYLFSARLVRAAGLDATVEDYAVFDSIVCGPPHRWGEAANQFLRERLQSPFYTLWIRIPSLLGLENLTTLEWLHTRTGIAMAWYEAERGMMPSTLHDLVPKYLPAVPCDPGTGAPLEYGAKGLCLPHRGTVLTIRRH
jgi:hypothetical protein